MILTHSSSPGVDDLLGRLDVVDRHLGDVDQALDALADLDERPERHQLRDPGRRPARPLSWPPANSCQGSCWVALSDREMRSRSRSTSSTCTVTSSPTCTTELG